MRPSQYDYQLGYHQSDDDHNPSPGFHGMCNNAYQEPQHSDAVLLDKVASLEREVANQKATIQSIRIAVSKHGEVLFHDASRRVTPEELETDLYHEVAQILGMKVA